MDARGHASAERDELAEFCRSLSAEDWEQPSLCEGWRVKDVIAHLISYDELGFAGSAALLVRAGFSVDRFNALAIRTRTSRPVDSLVDTLQKQVELGRVSKVLRGLPALIDAVIHHQDIRRPLGRPRQIPSERLHLTLNGVLRSPVIGGARRARGIRLVADDLDWQHGDGAVLTGPAEAILMTLAGRRAALDDLDGPGQAALSAAI